MDTAFSPRLCERCWQHIPPGSDCLHINHIDLYHPFLANLRSYRHLADDPACTGAQRPGDSID